MKNSKIKLLVSDIDGTLTNGLMTFDQLGNVSKSYYVNDCTGLWSLQNEHGVKVLILTGSNHACDMHRFKFLDGKNHAFGDASKSPNKDLFSGDYLIQNAPYNQKLSIMSEYTVKRGISLDEVAYIGDAENDMECMKAVGWSACPRNAVDSIKKISNYICEKDGGNGAVREFTDLVIKMNSF